MNKHVLVSSLLVIAALSASVWPPVALAWRAPTGAEPAWVVSQGDPLDKVEPLILKELAVAGQTDFFIWMTEKADLGPAYQLGTKIDKGRFVFETLRATAERAQKNLRASLDQQGLRYESFYIANKILVRGGNKATLLSIAARPDVAKITANHTFQLEKPLVNSSPLAALDDGPTPALDATATRAASPTATPTPAAIAATAATRAPAAPVAQIPAAAGRMVQATLTSKPSATPTALPPGTATVSPTRTPSMTPSNTPSMTPTYAPGVGPSIAFINADHVWALGYTGQDTVLAGNDTGLDETHPAIARHYRGCLNPPACTAWDHNYNWWDATGTFPNNPYDGYGHGTHTAGTLVGDDGSANQIGVAPGAKTIHCKNMTDSGGGDDATFTTCFQWDLAPWDLTGANPRPDLAPDAINNSWGYAGGGVPQFEDEIAALQAAGIVVVASAGNSGPSCATLGSPGDYRQLLTTGSVRHSSGALPGALTEFSSRGPSDLYPSAPDYFPDIMAPGENVRSSLPGNSYAFWSGTSMAAPHTTALIGLIWSANPGLRGLVTETVQIIQDTAVRLTGQSGSNCGGDYTNGPNNDWGYGTLDALAAVQSALLFGSAGKLVGTVTESGTGDPLASAPIRASKNPTLTWHTTTDALGHYALNVFSGTYTVTAGSYGYYPETRAGVQVTQDTTTTLDLALDPAPFYVVSGTVRDAAAGWPLYARIQVDGYPDGPIWNNPVSGFYSITLAAGITYTFSITAWVSGYNAASRAVGPLTGNRTEDIALAANTVTCNAPGYRFNYAHLQDFEAGNGGYSVSGATSWAWGAPSSGPGRAHSGAKLWATNLSGDYGSNERGYITSPNIDLSAYTGQPLTLHWWQWLQTERGYDFASAEVSNNGGTTWNLVYGPASGNVAMTWARHSLALDPSFAVSGFRVRFHLTSDYSVVYPGWYVDDVGVSTSCDLQAGGLVVGNTYDANTGMSLAGATVSNDSGDVSTSWATLDPAVDDSFYTLFSPPGSHVLTATHVGGYMAVVTTTNVVQSRTVQQNLQLPAGWLAYTPSGLQATLDIGQSVTVPFTLTNRGGAAAAFGLRETDRGRVPLSLGKMPDRPRSVAYWDPLETAPASARRLLLPDAWATGAPIPTGSRYRSAGASCDGSTLYIFGGQDATGAILGETWRYDPSTDVWTRMADMLVPLMNMDAACIDGNIYLVGGYTGSAHTNNLQVYNTANNTWTNSTWPNARTPMTAAWAGKLYAFGGNPGPSGETWVYDPATDTWTGSLAPMPAATAYGAATSVGDHIFVVGGGATRAVQRYDPASDAWSTGPALPAIRMNAITIWYGDRLYASSGGGFGGDIWTAFDDTLTLDTEVWPGGVWTIQGETVPTPVVGAAYDCVHNRIYAAGGADAGYIYATNQYLDDGLRCHFATDVPWLSESPVSGTIASLVDQPIAVTFDAGASHVTQPGTYQAELRITHDTPYSMLHVPVTMTVETPPTWGKLMGTVTGLAHCDAPGAPLSQATAFVQSGSGLTWTLTTNVSGTYQLWLAAANSPLTITISHAGYVTRTVTGVRVTAQQTTTQNLDLRLDAPCISANPNGMAVTLTMGLSTTLPFTLTNAGAGATTFQLQEQDGGFGVRGLGHHTASRAIPLPSDRDLTLLNRPVRPSADNLSSLQPTSVNSPGAPAFDDFNRPDGPLGPNWTVHNGTFGIVSHAARGDGVALATYNGASSDVVEIDIAADGMVNVQYAAAVLNYNTLSDNIFVKVQNSGATFQFDSGACYLGNNGSSGSFGLGFFGLSSPFTTAHMRVTRSGDAVTIELTNIDGGAQPDQTYVCANAPASIGTGVGIAAYDTRAALDNFRAASPDVPWLAESPISGTLAASSSQPISVRFDAGVPEIMLPGRYYATLLIQSNDPVNPSTAIPVTMTVETPPTWGKLMGTVTGLAHCDAPGAPLSQATAFVQSGSGLTRTLTTNAGGAYQLWLAAANSPLTITISHAGYVTRTVTGVRVTAQQTTTQNLDLRLSAPCVQVSPKSLQADLDLGVRQTVRLTMTNTGAAATTFQLADGDNGFQPIVLGPYRTTGDESGAVELPEQPRGVAPVQVQGSAVVVQENKARSLDGVTPGPVPLWSGGPDPFGYTYQDSREPGGPSYVWIEIAPPAGGSGIELAPLSGIDEGYYWPLSLPFAFNFYGTSYTALAVASNGTLYFEDNYLGFINTPIPSSTYYSVNRFIANLWSDLYVVPGAIYYQAQPDRFIIEYYQVSACCSSPSSGTWEIILFANGNLLFQYKDVSFGDSRDNGAYATIGIQGDATTGLQYSYNAAALANDLAICFTYPGQPSGCQADAAWLGESPASGALGAPATRVVSVTFDAGAVQQPGTFLAMLAVRSSDPVSGTYVLPVTMTVPAPPAWGQAHGRVYSLGYCDSSPALLLGAQVMITTSAGVTHTFTQSGAEPWLWWAAPGPMTITAYAPGHRTQTIVTQIPTGQGINQDIGLRWLHNCGGVVPSPVTLVLPPNVTTRVPLSLTNRGALPWTWRLSEDSTWLSISGLPAGTVGPASTLPSQLTIDTTGMSSGATYTAVIAVAHDDDRQPSPLPLLVRVMIAAHKAFLPSILK